MQKRDINALMFAVEMLEKLQPQADKESKVQITMAIESLHNVINRKIESLPSYSSDWNRINVGPYTIFQPTEGSVYISHVEGEGGAFSTAAFLGAVNNFFTEHF
jgi:hypothetical protein